MRKLIFTAVMALAAALAAGAVSPYPVLSERADRFFDQKEWNQAAAVYDLMIDERGDIPATYGRAIVANGMRGDKPAMMRLMTKALDNHVPFDSVFSRVRQSSFELGKSNLYEEFLSDVRASHPWMKRTIDSYLLQYFTFRRNGKMIGRYSGIMLAGAPDNVRFMTMQANGLVLEGEFPQAMAVYNHILEIEPENYQALINLGNYYAMQPDGASLALGYLRRAQAVHATPYVASAIESLSR